MCQSMAEGGQRCAAHTRSRAQIAMLRVEESTFGYVRDVEHAALVEHATTKEGRRELKRRVAEYESVGRIRHAESIAAAIREGDRLRLSRQQAHLMLQGQIRDSLGPVRAQVVSDLCERFPESSTWQVREVLATEVDRAQDEVRGVFGFAPGDFVGQLEQEAATQIVVGRAVIAACLALTMT